MQLGAGIGPLARRLNIMPSAFTADPAHTAVLAMDCQAGIVSAYAGGDKDAFLARASSVLDHARAAAFLFECGL